MPIRQLCSNPVYILLVLAISSLYFVVSGLQFWITTYLTTVLSIPMSEVFTFYIITCLSAPAVGLSLSIIMFNCIGGYNSRGALPLCLLFGILACLVSLPVPFASSCGSVYTLFWLIFFFGAIILAPLVGMMLNQVPKEGRATANSFATLCYSLFGYFPAPFVFGSFADRDKSDPIGSMRFAMGVNTYWSIFAALFLLFATLIELSRSKNSKDARMVHGEDYKRLDRNSPIANSSRAHTAALLI